MGRTSRNGGFSISSKKTAALALGRDHDYRALGRVTAGITTSASAADAPAAGDLAPGIPDSAALSTQVVAEGSLRGNSGRPLDGEMVLLQAWPGPDVLKTLQPGDDVKVVTVAKATTGADGGYEMRIGADGVETLQRYATDTGLVDLELVAPTGAAPSFSFLRRLVGAGAGAELRQPDPAPGLSVAAARTPEHVDLVGARTVGRHSPSAEPTDAAVVEKSCSTKLVKYVGVRKVLVGQAYSNVDGVPTTFTYTKGASSTLGIGVSVNGTYGSYKAGGTNTREASDSEVPDELRRQPPLLRHVVPVRQYKTTCTSGLVGPIWPYKVRAAYWAGGTDDRLLSSSPKAPKCRNFSAGSEFTKDDSNAVTWSNGADISGAIGIDLSVRTGYRTNSRLHYLFKKKRALCGTNDYPAGTPARLVVRVAQ